MRKLFWCCAACLLAGGGGVYLVAEYANRHPESFVAGCFSTSVYQDAARQGCTGLATCLEQAVQTARAMRTALGCQDGIPEGPMPDATPETCPSAVAATEPIEVTMPPAGGCPGATCQDPPDAMIAAVGSGYEQSEAPLAGPGCAAGHPEDAPCQTGGPGGVPESDAVPMMPGCAAIEPEDVPYMPPLTEEETPKPCTPPQETGGCCATPHVAEEAEMKEDEDAVFPFNVWQAWFKKDPTKEGGAHEESELVPAAGDPPTAEGTTPVGPADVPHCQEDPNYDMHYSGCPYTGGCPSGHCPTPREPVAPAEINKKDDPKAGPMSHKAKSGKGGGLEEGGDAGVVDTMECRPSDAQKTGFDPHDPF